MIHNGIDLGEYRPTPNPAVLARYQINHEQPFVLFVGRITRQKGIIHLVDADEGHSARESRWCSARGPGHGGDRPGDERGGGTGPPRRHRSRLSGFPRLLPRDEVIHLYSHASFFVCPSVYEPFGIINLEAMACETPVVASAVGEIKEVVVPGETGLLVPFEAAGPTDFEPKDPARFVQDLAAGVNRFSTIPCGVGNGHPVSRPGRTLQLVGHRQAHARILFRPAIHAPSMTATAGWKA